MVAFFGEGPGTDPLDRVRRLGSRPKERQPPAVSASDETGTVTIAGNPGVEVPAGTLNSALKQAGLKK
jgi:hypothetical protein